VGPAVPGADHPARLDGTATAADAGPARRDRRRPGRVDAVLRALQGSTPITEYLAPDNVGRIMAGKQG
jgi:hypothetical protein